ncbi:ATP-grasp domain-containing protein [Paenibacillus sp. FSL H8-0537]|uniref:ATP-grasp domain-containing protein n=1 Tax=Paenibacillus sp. FSL H8-0537 TaxID=2921399 RepID=UPI0031018971
MSNVTKVWFNRWFSVAYHYMNAIRNNSDGAAFELYGTHADPKHMSLQACDVVEVEPSVKGEAYVDFCIEFCLRHKIDVFVPRLNMLDIVKSIKRFDEIGVKVVVCQDEELLGKLMVKDQFYESVSESGIMVIPDYHVVSTAEQFKAAYDDLASKGHRVCFKPTDGEGGQGFRIIDNERDKLADLFGSVSRALSFEEVYRTLSTVPQFGDLMVMELLDGFEYSIDCLAAPNGELLAAVPRRKAGGRLRLLDDVPELLEIAQRVSETYKIPYNYNIQMKYKNGVPKLLEINPRMSGGLHVSCLSGINFPYLAVKLALGGTVGKLTPEYGVLASHVEQPMRLTAFE